MPHPATVSVERDRDSDMAHEKETHRLRQRQRDNCCVWHFRNTFLRSIRCGLTVPNRLRIARNANASTRTPRTTRSLSPPPSLSVSLSESISLIRLQMLRPCFLFHNCLFVCLGEPNAKNQNPNQKQTTTRRIRSRRRRRNINRFILFFTMTFWVSLRHKMVSLMLMLHKDFFFLAHHHFIFCGVRN